MSDDKQERGPADRNRVDVHEPYELQYWTKSFGVSAEKLKETVKRVGPMVKDIESALGN